jgi:hypothetical protein
MSLKAIAAIKSALSRLDASINLSAPRRLPLFGAMTNGLPNHHPELLEIYLGFRAKHHNDSKSQSDYEKEFESYASTSDRHFNTIFNIFRDELKVELTQAETEALSEITANSGERAFKVAKTSLVKYEASLLDLNDPEGSRSYTSQINLPTPNTDPGLTQYFQLKGLNKLAGSAYESGVETVVPLTDLITKDSHPELVYNYQIISPDGGKKRCITGLTQKGLVYFVPSREAVYASKIVVVNEGVATAETGYLATGIPQIAAVNGCNLLWSAISMIEFGFAEKILFAVDTDHDATKKAKQNVSICQAGISAKGSNCLIGFAVPELKGTNKDYNDLMVAEGVEVVKAAIEFALSALDTPPEAITNDDKDKLTTFVHERNKEYAKVMYAGKFRIMRSYKASVLIGDNYEIQHRHDFESFNERVKWASHEPKFKVGDGLVNRITAWANHKEVRAYADVIFEPYNTHDKALTYKGSDAYNLWQGYGVTPVNHGITYPYLSRLIYKICDGNAAWINYLYDWIAIGYQKPQSKVGVALCIRGGEGSGKGSLLHFLRKLWGSHGGYVSNGKQVTGNFNGHLAGLCYLFADEAIFAGDKQSANAIKSLITEDIIAIERKGFDVTQERNYLRIAMASNHDWMLDASADARRFCIFDLAVIPDDDVFYLDGTHYIKRTVEEAEELTRIWGPDQDKREVIQAKQFYKELHQELDRVEIKEQFLFDILNRDIADFIPNKNIPQTRALKDQKLHSLSGDSIVMWLIQLLIEDKGEIPEFNKEGKLVTTHFFISYNDSWIGISSKMLYDHYNAYCKKVDVRGFKLINPVHFGKYLTAQGVLSRKGRDNTMRAVKSSFLQELQTKLGIA